VTLTFSFVLVDQLNKGVVQGPMTREITHRGLITSIIAQLLINLIVLLHMLICLIQQKLLVFNAFTIIKGVITVTPVL